MPEEITQRESPWLTPKEAATYIGVSLGTVRNWTSAKYIPFSKRGRVVRYRKELLDEWLARGSCKGRNQIANSFHGSTREFFMSGVMQIAARTAAIEALRTAALRVAQEIEAGSLKQEALAPSYPHLKRLWRSFPETTADCNPPPIKEIIAAIAKVDAVDSFDKKDRLTKANRFMTNQQDFLDS